MANIKVNGGVLVPNVSNVQPDVLKMLVKLDPMRTPLLDWLILSNKTSKVVTSPYGKFEWFKRAFVPHIFNVGGTAITPTSQIWTLSATNITNFSELAGVLQANDLVLVRISGGYHILRVDSNNGTNVVLKVVDSSQQSGVTGAIEANSIIRTMGQLLYDGHGRLDYISVQEENVYNYLKEFVYYVETTGRQQAGQYFTDGMSHAERVAQKFIEAKLEIERYLWFATLRGALSSTNGNNQATFGYGIDAQISTAVSYSTAMTETVWRNALKTAFKYGSGKKIAYLGADLMDDVERFMQNYYEINQTGSSSLFNEIGLTAKSYRTFSGVITLVWNPIFDGDRVGNGYVLDEEQVLLRYMADDERGSRKLRVRDNVGIGYEDKKVTEILADVGVMIKDERTCLKLIKA